MSEYCPDRWIILEMDYRDSEGPICKVFGNWYGGYMGSDSWKLSSGICKVVEHDDHYEFHNVSGSIYKCYKHEVGTSGYGAGVLNSFYKQAEESDGKFSIKEIAVHAVRTIV